MLEVEATVAENLGLCAESRGRPAENFALLDKIRKFLHIIHTLPTFSLGCIKTQIVRGRGEKFRK